MMQTIFKANDGRTVELMWSADEATQTVSLNLYVSPKNLTIAQLKTPTADGHHPNAHGPVTISAETARQLGQALIAIAESGLA